LIEGHVLGLGVGVVSLLTSLLISQSLSIRKLEICPVLIM